jgi:hypothetical protein
MINQNKNIYPHIILAMYMMACFGCYLTYLYPWLSDALLLLSLFSLTKIKYNFNNNRILLFILLCLLLIHSSISFENGFTPTKVAILLPSLAFICEDDLVQIFKFFTKIQVISLIPSLIILFAYIIGVENIFPSHIEDWGRPFIVYPGTTIQPDDLTIVSGINFFRISGIQGESGGVGAINLFILIANRFNLKSKQNIFLLLTGLISFSFAFYLLITIYLVLSLIFDSEIKKIIIKIKWLIMFIVVLLIISGFYDKYIGDRNSGLDFNENKKVDQRIRVPIDEYFAFFFSQEIEYIIWGHGSSANSSPNAYVGAGGINFMAYLYNFGLYGFFLLFGTLFYLFYNGSFKSTIPFFIILASLYQRPYMINIGYFLMFFALAPRCLF